MEIEPEKARGLIKRYLSFYQELDYGVRIPITEAQKHFIDVCRGRCEPQTEHEYVYLWVKNRIRKFDEYKQDEGTHVGIKDSAVNRLSICCLKGYVDGRKKGLKEKIEKYLNAIQIQIRNLGSIFEEIEEEIMKKSASTVKCRDIFDLMADEYEADPENKEMLFEYNDYFVDRLLDESDRLANENRDAFGEEDDDDQFEEEEDRKKRIRHAKFLLRRNKKYLGCAQKELSILERLEGDETRSFTDEIVLLGANHEELAAYKKGFDQAYSEANANFETDIIIKSYPRAGLPWSSKEDEELKRLFAEGRKASELSRVFQRKKSAIFSRLCKLGLRK